LRTRGNVIAAARRRAAFRSLTAVGRPGTGAYRGLARLAIAYPALAGLARASTPDRSLRVLKTLGVTYPPALTPGPRQRLRGRVRMTTYVTAVEVGGLYAWLRLTRSGRAPLGAACLVVKETFESGILLLIFIRGPQQPYDPADPAVAAHLRESELKSAAAFDSEILIWLTSYALSEHAGWPLAALFLLVSMHLKHQLEAAILYDEPYWSQFLKPVVVIGSLTESIGGLSSLLATRADRRSRTVASLLGGIGIEHILFIHAVQNEMEKRDICLPRPTPTAG
jgi:hypothetical protein